MTIEKLQTLCRKKCEICNLVNKCLARCERSISFDDQDDRYRDKNFSNLQYKPSILFKYNVHAIGDTTNNGLCKIQTLNTKPNQPIVQSAICKPSLPILNNTKSSNEKKYFAMTPTINIASKKSLKFSATMLDQHNTFSRLEDEIKMNDFKQNANLLPYYVLPVSKCLPKQNHLDNNSSKDDYLAHLDKNNNKRQSSESEILSELFSWRNFHFKPPDVLAYLMKSTASARPKTLKGGASEMYRNEGKRILTFSTFPRDAEKSALLLAENGFIYKGSGKKKSDRVQCVFCGVEKQNWRRKDKIKAAHRRTCAMRTNRTNSNSPLNLNLSHINVNQVRRKLFKTRNLTDKHYELMRSNHVQWADKSFLSNTTETALQIFQHARRQTSLWLQESEHPTASQNPRSLLVTSLSESRILENSLINEATVGSSDVNTSESRFLENPLINEATVGSSDVNTTVAPPNVNSTLLQEDTTTTEPATAAPLTASSETRTVDAQTPQASSGISAQQPDAEQGTRSLAESRPRNGRDPTYEELGIITERPKRTEYALKIKRLETFASWPRDHHLLPEELSDAGFYYAGYGDCARCFFCGGGLRNWEDEDNVWVEHARWFPKCAYIRQLMGQVFVNTVQGMNTEFDKITMAMVTEKMGLPSSTFQLDTLNTPLKRDAAVRAVVCLGYQEQDVLEITQLIKQEGNTVSAEAIVQRLVQEEKRPTHPRDEATFSYLNNAQALEIIRELNERNGQLRQQTICKICMDREVAVVFLPCGHLVSCSECASAMRNCPLCRNPVRGIVRAFMG